MRMLVFIAFIIVVFTSQPSAKTFKDETHKFSINFSSDWRAVESPTPVKLTLICVASDCAPTSRVFINSNYEPRLKNMTQTDFFQNIQPSMLPGMVDQMMAGFGRVVSSADIRKSKVGNTRGYLGTYVVKYRNGQNRNLYYAMSFNRGVFYHLQFFADPESFDNDLRKAKELFKTFRLLD